MVMYGSKRPQKVPVGEVLLLRLTIGDSEIELTECTDVAKVQVVLEKAIELNNAIRDAQPKPPEEVQVPLKPVKRKPLGLDEDEDEDEDEDDFEEDEDT